MTLEVLCIEQKKVPGLSDLNIEYSQKIQRFVPFTIHSIKGAKLNRADRLRKIEAESDALLQQLKATDYVILFDEQGRNLDSHQFSKRLVQAFESGKRRVVFIIGGAYGMSAALKSRAQESWSLSPLTLAHPIAMALALEQIYRALTIWKGIPYHNE